VVGNKLEWYRYDYRTVESFITRVTVSTQYREDRRASCHGVIRIYAEHRAVKQELSYRKQIARLLRTQYVKGIYNNSVTLKYELRVTEGHWKRNH